MPRTAESAPRIRHGSWSHAPSITGRVEWCAWCLRDERDRYRAALEAIPGALPDLGMRTVRRIVREALEGEE